MIIRDCRNIMCTDPLYAGECKKECVKRYEKEMGLKKADLVEVVRCGNCKHYSTISPSGGVFYKFPICHKFRNATKTTDFCSYGERKDNDG